MLDVVWMDYDTLAQRLGIGRDSARQRAKRGHWGRRRDNAGVMQVGVPAEVLEALPDRDHDRDPVGDQGDPDRDHDRDPVTVDRDHDHDLIAGTTAILSRHIERLEAALAVAQDGLTAAHQERDEARATERALAAQVEALNVVLAIERERVADERRQSEERVTAARERAAEERRQSEARIAAERQRADDWKLAADRFASQAERLAERRPWWRRLAG